MTGFSFAKNARSQANGIRSSNYSYEENYGNDDCKTRIKFTRKFTHQYKNCCCILLSLSISLLSACVVLFCAYYYVKIEPGEELSYQGSFAISYNDSYRSALLNSSSFQKLEATIYINAIEKALQVQPLLRLSLLSVDILAIDRETDKKNATVLFELKFNPRLMFGADTDDLLHLLKQNLRIPNGVTDIQNVSLRKMHSSLLMSSSSLSPNLLPFSHILDDNFANVLGRCVPAFQLPFCPPIYNNLTSYPNIFMHKNAKEVNEDVIVFRELIDGECFAYAAEFLCQVLQPGCVQRSTSSVDETFLPCREFCREFLAGCGSRFSERLSQSLDCFKFPEFSQYGRNCRKQPNCNIAALETNDPFSYRLCDGVIDCVNLEDELPCSYCSSNDLHCGIHKHCIPRESFCNDVPDCPDGSDEKNCLSLWPNITSGVPIKTALDSLNYKEGYVIYTRGGTSANVCIEDENTDESVLREVGQSICKSTSYQDLQQVEVKPITQLSAANAYTHFGLHQDLNSSTPYPLTSNCTSNRVLYVSCSDVECGVQTTRSNTNTLDGLNKIATAGDWPWHVALFKNGVHSCDATLLSESWLITSIACFQGQSKAEWVARFGAVRLYGKSPWLQERHIVGMVKSPVEGSTLVLIKLSSPVIYSHFVRPVCLPFNHAPAEELLYCNALGWSKVKGMLQRLEIKETAVDNCEDMSIMMHNGLCAASAFDVDECNEEEMAGSSMICLTSQQQKWVLIGISNWRISCSPIGMQRPRLYDKVVSNVNWIRSIIRQ